MSRQRISTSQESRISRLEKRDADDGSGPPENGAAIPNPVRLERPRDMLLLFEGAAALAYNDPRCIGVAKSRALRSIVDAAARIMPMVEMADLHEQDWETKLRAQETLCDLASRSPRAKKAWEAIYHA
jgi:hypothetical protein